MPSHHCNRLGRDRRDDSWYGPGLPYGMDGNAQTSEFKDYVLAYGARRRN